jgi:dCMP deaminase
MPGSTGRRHRGRPPAEGGSIVHTGMVACFFAIAIAIASAVAIAVNDHVHETGRTRPFRVARQSSILRRAARDGAGAMRDDWHTFWMKQAFLYASRSTCDRRHVGCVVVRQNRLISAGYNGSLPGLPHCDEAGHLFLEGRSGCQRTSHAEANAVAQAARMGHPTEGAEAYVTTLPCLSCFKLLAMAGVNRVYYAEDYREEYAHQLAEEAGVALVPWPLKDGGG